MNAEIGTPAGSSHAGSSTGFCVAATVKREFGCAATRALPPWPPSLADCGVQSLPCQSIRCAGASLVMTSHHTSPSSVNATLVKMVLAVIDAMQLGLVVWLVPGATPK